MEALLRQLVHFHIQVSRRNGRIPVHHNFTFEIFQRKETLEHLNNIYGVYRPDPNHHLTSRNYDFQRRTWDWMIPHPLRISSFPKQTKRQSAPIALFLSFFDSHDRLPSYYCRDLKLPFNLRPTRRVSWAKRSCVAAWNSPFLFPALVR